jgi:hypothetical protein
MFGGPDDRQDLVRLACGLWHSVFTPTKLSLLLRAATGGTAPAPQRALNPVGPKADSSDPVRLRLRTRPADGERPRAINAARKDTSQVAPALLSFA